MAADVLALEDRGLALTMTALRVAYAAGGDGEVCSPLIPSACALAPVQPAYRSRLFRGLACLDKTLNLVVLC